MALDHDGDLAGIPAGLCAGKRLQQLVADWDLLADLSFSDLVLWIPLDEAEDRFCAVAQIRPATGPTALESDVVGDEIAYEPEHLVTQAYLSQEICETSEGALGAGIPVDIHAVPLLASNADNETIVVAVLERHTNRMGVRAPGALEDAYLEAAEALTHMVWQGTYPQPVNDSDPAVSPRVGDGFLRVGPDAVVHYASPNAVTSVRRLGHIGDLEGENIVALMGGLGRSEMHLRSAEAVISHPGAFDLENDQGSIRVRIQPLTRDSLAAGAIVLCRDITALRRRERELSTKDATIREIHHRVKNNLQTVAALLRLQARRIASPEAKGALSAAMERVSAIAVVHEILSRGVEDEIALDEVCDRVLQMVGALASTRGAVVATRVGSFGIVPGDVATHLALIIAELCSNAIEHGLQSGGGQLKVLVERTNVELVFSVVDNGDGIDGTLDVTGDSSLGLSIVTTLVRDLDGRFTLQNREDGQTGAVATVRLPEAGLRRH